MSTRVLRSESPAIRFQSPSPNPARPESCKAHPCPSATTRSPTAPTAASAGPSPTSCTLASKVVSNATASTTTPDHPVRRTCRLSLLPSARPLPQSGSPPLSQPFASRNRQQPLQYRFPERPAPAQRDQSGGVVHPPLRSPTRSRSTAGVCPSTSTAANYPSSPASPPTTSVPYWMTMMTKWPWRTMTKKRSGSSWICRSRPARRFCPRCGTVSMRLELPIRCRDPWSFPANQQGITARNRTMDCVFGSTGSAGQLQHYGFCSSHLSDLGWR